MRPITIKDIAKAADVSYATVSRALNAKYGVNEGTRERIVKLAEELGYTPNAIARGLVSRQTHTIGLILPDITNPFYPEVAGGIEDAAADRGWGVLLCNTNWDPEREERYLRLLTERRVDGIIISPVSGDSRGTREAIDSLPVPVVYVAKAPKRSPRSCVTIDDVRGGYLATRHLIDEGYREIGFIGADTESSVDERLTGFRKAHAEAGIPVREQWIWLEDFRSETGYRTVRRTIESGGYPRAIFAENDLLAVGAIQGIREQGLRVPEDIAVVGFDDIPVASLQDVQLTTVAQPKREMGRIAAGLLFDAMVDEGAGVTTAGTDGTPGPNRVVLEPELIVRRSSRAVGAGDNATRA